MKTGNHLPRGNKMRQTLGRNLLRKQGEKMKKKKSKSEMVKLQICEAPVIIKKCLNWNITNALKSKPIKTSTK